MKSGANFQQRTHPSVEVDFPRRRFGDAADDLQERAFPGPVAAHEADHVALVHVKGDFLERPERLGSGAAQGMTQFAQGGFHQGRTLEPAALDRVRLG